MVEVQDFHLSGSPWSSGNAESMTSCFWAHNVVKLGGITIMAVNKNSTQNDITVRDLYTIYDDF